MLLMHEHVTSAEEIIETIRKGVHGPVAVYWHPLEADAPLALRLACVLEVRDQVRDRANRNFICFVDEMHAG